MRIRQLHAPVVTAAVLAAALSGCGDASHASTTSGAAVSGLLGIRAGSCSGDKPSGSYFRMVTPTGQQGKGPYVSNADSSCKDKTVTLLKPGSDGGLHLGTYQPQPSPPFGSGGNSASTAIVSPTPFFAVQFGVSTNAKDPQTGAKVPAPTASRNGKV